MSSSRPTSLSGRLARLGFGDPERARRLLADPVLAGLLDPLDEVFEDDLLLDLAEAPDPDLALTGLVRVMESLRAMNRLEPDDPLVAGADPAHLLQAIRVSGPVRHRLFAVLGSSAALADHLARHPAHWAVLSDDQIPTAAQLRTALLQAVHADPNATTPVADQGGSVGQDRLRVEYRRRLLSLAARDLSCPHPTAMLPSVGRELADLAAAALEAALAIARAELAPDAVPCRIAVIAMGKCGGRELNYVSDVDVIFVAEPTSTEPLAPNPLARRRSRPRCTLRICWPPG